MPAFNEVWMAKKDQFVLIGVATDKQPDPVQYVKDQGYEWVFGMDSGLAQQNNIEGLPTTLFIDRTGKEVKREVGGIDRATFEADLAMIL
jgi:hypothetical protein